MAGERGESYKLETRGAACVGGVVDSDPWRFVSRKKKSTNWRNGATSMGDGQRVQWL